MGTKQIELSELEHLHLDHSLYTGYIKCVDTLTLSQKKEMRKAQKEIERKINKINFEAGRPLLTFFTPKQNRWIKENCSFFKPVTKTFAQIAKEGVKVEYVLPPKYTSS